MIVGVFFRQVLAKHEPVYQAVWANNTDFDEVLISPVMIQDHMPDNVLDALNKVSWLVHARYLVVRKRLNANHIMTRLLVVWHEQLIYVFEF